MFDDIFKLTLLFFSFYLILNYPSCTLELITNIIGFDSLALCPFTYAQRTVLLLLINLPLPQQVQCSQTSFAFDAQEINPIFWCGERSESRKKAKYRLGRLVLQFSAPIAWTRSTAYSVVEVDAGTPILIATKIVLPQRPTTGDCTKYWTKCQWMGATNRSCLYGRLLIRKWPLARLNKFRITISVMRWPHQIGKWQRKSFLILIRAILQRDRSMHQCIVQSIIQA